MTLEEKLAKFLACAVYELGGSLTISKALLDGMLPTRLVLDETTDPDKVSLEIISNEVITITLDKEGTVEVI